MAEYRYRALHYRNVSYTHPTRMPVIVQIFIFNKFQEKNIFNFLLDEEVKIVFIFAPKLVST